MTGCLMPMGGDLDTRGDCVVLREFWRLAGGARAKLVIIPTASSHPQAGERYVVVFRALGVRTPATVLPINSRAEAQQAAYCRALAAATGIFFTGGNQVRLSATLGGTPVAAALQAAYARGALLGGTSAGASCLAALMFAYGKSGASPRQGLAQFVPGLGFTAQAIFDQHFRERDRLGRLLYAVANHPGLLGVGIDGNTAVVLTGSQLQVVGENTVTIVDGAALQATNVAEVLPPRPIAMSGARVHLLTQGCSFDLKHRTAVIPKVMLEVE